MMNKKVIKVILEIANYGITLLIGLLGGTQL